MRLASVNSEAVPKTAPDEAPNPEQPVSETSPTDSGREARLHGNVEEVVVTGTQIRGADNTTVHTVVLGRDYIDSTGFSTTTQLIQSLPQNFALEDQSGVNVPGTTTSGEQGASVNLRGVGEGTTLVLLNGRRMAPGFQGNAVDISALPLSAIERVEVLTDGASAIYGSDAIGGVVNFITRHDFSGAETQLHRGWADNANEDRVSQMLGGAWNGARKVVSKT